MHIHALYGVTREVLISKLCWQELITLYVLYKNDTFMDNMPVSCVLSNMMLQGIRVCALVIIGFTAVSYGEPAYRRHRTLGYQINNNNKNINTDDDNNSSFDPVTVNCTGTRADSPECRLFKVKPKNDTISDVSNEKNSPVENIDKEKPWSITDLFYDDGDDSAVEEGKILLVDWIDCDWFINFL